MVEVLQQLGIDVRPLMRPPSRKPYPDWINQVHQFPKGYKVPEFVLWDSHNNLNSGYEQGYENPREATGHIVCANCHLANMTVEIEVPQAVLPNTVFEAVVQIPYDMQLKQNWMLTLYLSESYAKKDLLLVRLRPSMANAIIGMELILLTFPPEMSSLRTDLTFLLPSQADAEPHYLAALQNPRGESGFDRRENEISMVMKEGEMLGR
ncbi:hypothetical protein T459_25444 [Capsicum annuum]|uniref:Cytochrome f large domain-containing protein n=1 Tax=Capsicum annuum TaxID=4072 RepID=A0A2G2YKR7_CAPAN|nr:hypothetical protein T459_25444 [Capsicum annuum]